MPSAEGSTRELETQTPLLLLQLCRWQGKFEPWVCELSTAASVLLPGFMSLCPLGMMVLVHFVQC